MPKVRSQRSISRAHITSVKPVNRPFAIQDNAVQHLDVGALKDVSIKADEILRSVNADASRTEHASNTNKKERRILKHELFIERLEASRAPYSKSHARRLKRKEREQLAGGRLGSLKAALPSIVPTTPASISASTRAATSAGEAGAPAAPARVEQVVAIITSTATAAGGGTSAKLVGKSCDDDREKTHREGARLGQIGKGKGAPLTRSQRRRALKAESFRQPLIRSNPEFAANPFETIRTHARNTLAPHQP